MNMAEACYYGIDECFIIIHASGLLWVRFASSELPDATSRAMSLQVSLSFGEAVRRLGLPWNLQKKEKI